MEGTGFFSKRSIEWKRLRDQSQHVNRRYYCIRFVQPHIDNIPWQTWQTDAICQKLTCSFTYTWFSICRTEDEHKQCKCIVTCCFSYWFAFTTHAGVTGDESLLRKKQMIPQSPRTHVSFTKSPNVVWIRYVMITNTQLVTYTLMGQHSTRV